jgi:energy-coupling factor transport system ATP-binding protein
MEDALNYADYIIILNNGEKYLEGTPEEIFQKEAEIRKVQLDVPESIQFAKLYNEKFKANIPLKKQSIQEIVKNVKETLGASHE